MIQYLEFNDLVSSDKYRNRYYDAHSGRFLQEDPDPGKLNNPITFNSKYIYANNNPVMYSDPTGRFGFLAALAWTAVYTAGISAIKLLCRMGSGQIISLKIG